MGGGGGVLKLVLQHSISAGKERNRRIRLPDKIKSCRSVNSFNSQLKTHLLLIHFN